MPPLAFPPRRRGSAAPAGRSPRPPRVPLRGAAALSAALRALALLAPAAALGAAPASAQTASILLTEDGSTNPLPRRIVIVEGGGQFGFDIGGSELQTDISRVKMWVNSQSEDTNWETACNGTHGKGPEDGMTNTNVIRIDSLDRSLSDTRQEIGYFTSDTDGITRGTSVTWNTNYPANATPVEAFMEACEDNSNMVHERLRLTFDGIISQPGSNYRGAATSLDIQIIDNDAPAPVLTLDTPSATEGGTLTFTAELSELSADDVSFEVNVTGGVTSGDYDGSINGTRFEIPAGATTVTFGIVTLDDSEVEGDETLQVTLSDLMPGTGGRAATFSGGGTTLTGTGTIVDNDSAPGPGAPQPELSIDMPEVPEGDAGTATLVFTVTLNAMSSGEVSVDYRDTGNGTAMSGIDYMPLVADTLVFMPGETSKTIPVTILSDRAVAGDEAPTETVVIELENLAGATFDGGGSTLTGTGRIRNDDYELLIDSPEEAETRNALVDRSLDFTVRLSATSAQDVTVDYAVTGGTATSSVNYTPPAGSTLTIPAGQQSGTIPLPILNDGVNRAPKTVELTLSSPTGARFPDGRSEITGTGTIYNDLSVVTISAVDVQEAAGTTATLEFRATLYRASSSVVINYETGPGGTATPGADFQAVMSPGRDVTISSSATSATFSITVNDDDIDEENETVAVEIALTDGVFAGPSVTGEDRRVVRGTILDNDDPPVVSIDASPSVLEGDAGTANLEFTVSLSATSGKTVTVDHETVDGTATVADSDYTGLPRQELSFPPGTTSRTVTVSVNGDTRSEGDETLSLRLTNPDNATFAASGQPQPAEITETGTIRNDDYGLSIDSPERPEGPAGTSATHEFTVTLDPASPQEVTVDYAVLAASTTATAGADYGTLAGGTLTFAPNATTQPIPLTVTGDDLDEVDEKVVVELSNANGAGIVTGRGTFTIRDDDPPPTVMIDRPGVDEGAMGTTATLRFTVTLSASSSKEVTVGYRDTQGGSAEVADNDYAAVAPGTLRFLPGETSKTIDVTVNGDDGFEGDETVEIELRDAVDATIPGGVLRGTGTIRNDDTATVPTFVIGPASVGEGDTGTSMLRFTVTLSGATSQPVMVGYAVAEAAGTATAGTDYQAATGTLTFNPGGGATQPIDITVNGDLRDEEDETVVVMLSNQSPNTVIATARGTGVIRDDDDPPTVSIASAGVDEGDTGRATLAFTVTLSPPSGKVVTVDYSDTRGGSADAGVDYDMLPDGTLTFAPGQDSMTIEVMVRGDAGFEPDETVVIEIPNADNATIPGGVLTATGMIRNDDAPAGARPMLSIDSPSVAEGASGTPTTLEFTVTLSATSSGTVRVDYGVGGTADAGTDYQARAGGTLTFNPGETEKKIAFTVNGDDEIEADETVVVTLSNGVGAGIGTGAGTGTIRNDDLPELAVADAPVVEEGDSGTTDLVFTVTLGQPALEDVTVEYEVTGGTAQSEFAGVRGTVTIRAGQTSAEIRIPVMGDNVDELDKTLEITLSNPAGATIRAGGDVGTGTIRNDDRRLSIAPRALEAAEGALGASTPREFTVSLSATSSHEVSVRYGVATSSSTARPDDYALVPGTLTFMAGEGEKTITVTVRGDGKTEHDERVVVRLSDPANAVIAQGEGVLTIRNDDPVLAAGRPARKAGAAATVEVALTLEPASSGPVTVDYDVLGASTTPSSGTLRIPAGETSGMIEVAVDSGDASRVRFRFSNPAGAQFLPDREGEEPLDTFTTGTPQGSGSVEAVTNVLASVGRMIAANVVDLIWDRVGNHRSGSGGSYAMVGGRALDTGAFTGGGGALRAAGALAGLLGVDVRSPEGLLRGAERRLARGGGLDSLRGWADLPSDRDLVERTRFAASFANGLNGNSGGSFSIWGQGSFTAFERELEKEGETSAFSSEGEVVAGHLGIDYRSAGNSLVGIAVSHTLGDADYMFPDDGRKGGVTTELTSAHPYLHWMSPLGLGIWGSVGYGTGTVELKEESGPPVEADLAMEMTAFGVRTGPARLGGLNLALKADAFTAEFSTDGATGPLGLAEVSTDSSRVRFAVEGSFERVYGGGAVTAGRFELGARSDSGDAEKGTGADLVLGFGYAVPHLGFEMKGRGSLLLTHEKEGFKEWGLGLGLAWDPGARGRGLHFLVEPVWRAPTPAASMWDAVPGSPGRDRAPTDRGAALNARLGYGVGVWGDRALATVFGELGRADGGNRLRLGAGLRRPGAGGLDLDLYGERLERPAGPDRSVFLKGRLGF